MNFKVGDRVAARRDHPQFGAYLLPKDTLGTILEFPIITIDRATVRWDNGKQYYLELNTLVPAVPDNKLNRVLYPEYKPKDGYLIKE